VKAFQYLKRDWCGLPDAEEQLRIIRNCLSSIISRFASDTQSALVLGAGLGRIAWDISDHFDHLYATDLAWPMATFYNRIANGQPINFADINLSQIAYNIHSTKNLMASTAAVGYNEQQTAAINDKISYFISDATRLPLPDRSVSCIISVFFTDVLPFQQVFPEINRVLKEDGLFIHFGPLGNNFNQVQSMFTAEDIRSYMFRYGFEGVYENRAGSYHMKSGEKMPTFTTTGYMPRVKKKPPMNN
jgi:SAM-dependent methyltransferase